MTVTITQGLDLYVTQGDDHPADVILDQAVLSTDTTYLAKFPTGFVDFASINADVYALTVVEAVASGLVLEVDLIVEEWSPATVTGSNIPAGAGTPVTVGPLGALAAGDTIEFPIASLMQTVSDASADWRGVRIDVTAGGPVKVWTFRSDGLGPTQAVTVDDELVTPTNLSPDGGRAVSGAKVPLRVLDYARQLGDLELTQMRVQWSASPGGTILADNTQDVTKPEFDMSAETFTLLGRTGLSYWRTKLYSATGESPWSHWASTKMVALGTVTPTAPVDISYDLDPLLAWDFSGTQRSYKITRRSTRDGLVTVRNVPQEVPSSVESGRAGVEVLDYYPVEDTLEVWDNVPREAVPGFPDHVTTTLVWGVVDDQALPKPLITDLRLSPDGSPYIRVEWTGLADEYRVRANGDIVSGKLAAADVRVGADLFAWTWYGAVPNTLYTIRVQELVGGRGSGTSDQRDVVTQVSFWWLSNPTTGDHLVMLNVDPGEWTRPEPRTSFWAPSQGSPRWRKQRGQRLGYRTRITGELWHSDDNLRTAQSYARAFDRMVDTDDPLMLHAPHEAVPVAIANTSSTPQDDDWDLPRKIGFDVAQVDTSILAGDAGPPAQGITILIDFDNLPPGGTDGGAILADNPVMGDVVGGAKFEADAAAHESELGMRLPNTSGGSYAQLLVSPLEHVIDVYAPNGVSALPPGGKSFLRWSNAILGTIANIELGSSGAFKLKNHDNDPVAVLEEQIDAGMPFRLSVSVVTHLVDSETVYSLALWTGDNLEDRDPNSREDSIPVNNDGQAPDEKVELGALSTPGYVLDVDDIRIVNNTGDWPPPPLGTPPPAPPIPPGTVMHVGAPSQTSILVGAYAGGTDAEPISDADVLGVNVSTNSSMTGAIPHVAGHRDTASGWMPKVEVTGLATDTRYWMQLTRNGTPIGVVYAGRTRKPIGVATSTKLAVGGCHRGPKNGDDSSDLCFRDMAGLTDGWIADRAIHLGDFSYPNTLTDDPLTHLRMHAVALLDSGIVPANLRLAWERILDDHDANGHGPSNWPTFNDPRTAASLLAWKEFLPFPMADTSENPRGRYWSAVEGNYRDVFLDIRTLDKSDVRDNGRLPNDATTQLLGAAQEAWLEGQAIAAAAAGQLLFVWIGASWVGVTPVGFKGANGIAATFSDKPPSYQVSRDRISNMLASHLGDNVLFIASDSHANMQDDGTHELNGFASLVCGPYDQRLHAHFQNSYQTTYPAATSGDGTAESGGDPDGLTARRQQYQRIERAQVGDTVTVTATIRDCSSGVGGTPKTIGTPMVKTYTVGGGGGGGFAGIAGGEWIGGE